MSRVLQQSEVRAAWILLAPALLLIAVFFAIPVASGFLLSLTDFDVYGFGSLDTVRFVGLSNYTKLSDDPSFWRALRNTLYYVVMGGPLSVAASLVAALLLQSKLVRAKALFRTVYFAPVVTTLVAVAIVWRYLVHPHYGLVNYGLAGLNIPPIDWLGDPRWSMPAICFLSVWKNFGYNMLIFIAGLQSIPGELYESAAVDGAGSWRRFVNVTLPGLGPVFFFVVMTTMIGFFQLFAEPYVMTQGGPVGSTRSLILYLYEEGFRWWRIGTSSTIAVALFFVTWAAALIQLRLRRSVGA